MNTDKTILEQSKNFFQSIFDQPDIKQKFHSLLAAVRTQFSQFDPRDPARTTYPYEYLYIMILLAGMAGFKTKDDIHRFWVLNQDKLNFLMPSLPDDIASTSTITRAQRLIESEVMGDIMIKIFGEQYNIVRLAQNLLYAENLKERDVLACDGQAMRATGRRNKDGRKGGEFQITSIISYATGMTLGQVIHDKKNQEKSAIIELSDNVNIENTIVTWDAINTYYPLIKNIVVDKKADVFVSIKSNQGTLFEDCCTAYEAYNNNNTIYTEKGKSASGSSTIYSGGKIYTRNIVVLKAEDCFTQENKMKWECINTVAIIETTCNDPVTNKNTVSTRYYLSSIPFDLSKYPDLADDLLEISLRRWIVEINHWHLDNFFDQDNASFEDVDAAYCSSIISKFSMSVFNFAKKAYAEEENRYKGACSTPNLQCSCMDIEFSILLLESFFANDPKHLVNHELSQKYKFMKRKKENKRPSTVRKKVDDLENDPSKLAAFLRERKTKRRKLAN